jgi:hypothetical protein
MDSGPIPRQAGSRVMSPSNHPGASFGSAFRPKIESLRARLRKRRTRTCHLRCAPSGSSTYRASTPAEPKVARLVFMPVCAASLRNLVRNAARDPYRRKKSSWKERIRSAPPVACPGDEAPRFRRSIERLPACGLPAPACRPLPFCRTFS